MSSQVPDKDKKVVVYHYRANGSPVVKNGLDVITQSELNEMLKANPSLTSTTKPLPRRGARSVDIYQRDLLSETGPCAGEQHGNEGSNVAGVQLPLGIWFAGLVHGGWGEVTVLFKKVGQL